eukprot:gene7959-16292_t
MQLRKHVHKKAFNGFETNDIIRIVLGCDLYSMIEFVATGSSRTFNETASELEQRHETEKKELEEKIRFMIKQASKSKKAEIEAQTIQMKFDLRAKHLEEIEELEQSGEGKLYVKEIVQDSFPTSGPPVEMAALPIVANKELEEQQRIADKKAKAKRKKDKKANKDAEREQQKEELKANSGRSQREIELEQLNSLLVKEGLQVKEVAADGHCMYRALADQIALSEPHLIVTSQLDINPSTPSEVAVARLRSATASYIRHHPDDFAPFLGMESDTTESSQFSQYCNTIDSMEKAEWGGQLELKAISTMLNRKILVYSSNAPVVCMGEEYSGSHPIRVTYHRHFYALGEHYNSTTEICTRNVF